MAPITDYVISVSIDTAHLGSHLLHRFDEKWATYNIKI